jgi:hypothetical protein
MTNREIFEAAVSQFNTYKHANIDEAEALLNSILEAAGLGSLTHETIESIDEFSGNIYIETSYSCRGCADTSSYKFPSSILDAADPIKAARIWGLKEKITAESIERDRYISYTMSCNARLEKLEAELKTLT